MQAKAAIKYQHGVKSGKISGKSLYRTRLKGTDSQTRVFKKKEENTTLNAAVTLLVDGSGSMCGSKYVHAVKAASMLYEAIGTLRVPVEVIIFTDTSTVTHALVKKFDKQLTSDQVEERMCAVVDDMMCNNSDGESILWAYDRLTLRRENKKVMIVLSDGSPATSGKGDAMWFTKKVVKDIERKGLIDIIGIGIMDHNVKKIYKKNTVIDRAEELESAVLDVIKTRIID